MIIGFMKLDQSRIMELGRNVRRIRRKDSDHWKCAMANRSILRLFYDIEDIQEAWAGGFCKVIYYF